MVNWMLIWEILRFSKRLSQVKRPLGPAAEFAVEMGGALRYKY
jgi:hypothetical protein